MWTGEWAMVTGIVSTWMNTNEFSGGILESQSWTLAFELTKRIILLCAYVSVCVYTLHLHLICQRGGHIHIAMLKDFMSA